MKKLLCRVGTMQATIPPSHPQPAQQRSSWEVATLGEHTFNSRYCHKQAQQS